VRRSLLGLVVLLQVQSQSSLMISPPMLIFLLIPIRVNRTHRISPAGSIPPDTFFSAAERNLILLLSNPTIYSLTRDLFCLTQLLSLPDAAVSEKVVRLDG
jgi:hypothetical protein